MINPEPGLPELLAIASGYQQSRALMVAAELGIADVIGDETKSIGDLAAATDTHAPTLYRLLRALASISVFEEHDGPAFSLTPMGQHMRTDRQVSAGAMARFFGSDYQWQAWGDLLHSVRTGENAAKHVLGMDVWAYREAHPDANAIFNRAMESASASTAPLEVAAYDFGEKPMVVDVAGGTGAMLAAVLQHHPGARGILFDQAHVVSGAGSVLEAAGIADRVTVEAGSFFEKTPEDGDVYILRRILHDWPDKESVDILRCCRAAMKRDARLLVIDFVVGPPNRDPASKFFDLLMLVSAGGRERTEPEWQALLAAGGFRLESATRASATSSVIVGVPA